MPRWRKLHVKATESLDINDMPDDFHRLLWVMLPLGLDCEGRGLDNPAWIKAKVMTLRLDVTSEMIETAIQWYAQRGMVKRYEVDGRYYFWVPSFARYQGNTSKEAASEYPPPPVQSESGASPELVESESGTDADADVDSDTEIHAADAASPPEKIPTPAQAMFSALARICRYNLALLTEKQRGQLNQTGKILRKANVPPDDVTAFGDWWFKHDWRGTKDPPEPPKPHQVREEWDKFLDWRNNADGRSGATVYETGHAATGLGQPITAENVDIPLSEFLEHQAGDGAPG